MGTISMPLMPTTIGQRVRTRGYGGSVRMWMDTGVVVRFNRSGFPVVRLDDCHAHRQFLGAVGKLVTDRFGVFGVIDESGANLFQEVEVVR